jgi:hypothetical protein
MSSVAAAAVAASVGLLALSQRRAVRRNTPRDSQF